MNYYTQNNNYTWYMKAQNTFFCSHYSIIYTDNYFLFSNKIHVHLFTRNANKIKKYNNQFSYYIVLYCIPPAYRDHIMKGL